LSETNTRQPLWAHVNAIVTFSGLYIAWAYFGWWLTERLSYYFLDYQQLGWEYVLTSIVLFIAIGIAGRLLKMISLKSITDRVAFVLIYALIGIRTSLVKKAKDQSRN